MCMDAAAGVLLEYGRVRPLGRLGEDLRVHETREELRAGRSRLRANNVGKFSGGEDSADRDGTLGYQQNSSRSPPLGRPTSKRSAI